MTRCQSFDAHGSWVRVFRKTPAHIPARLPLPTGWIRGVRTWLAHRENATCWPRRALGQTPLVPELRLWPPELRQCLPLQRGRRAFVWQPQDTDTLPCWVVGSFLGAPSTSKARSLWGRHARGRPGKHQGLCPESGELHAGLTLCGVAQGPDESPDTAGTGLTSTPTPLCMGTRGCPASAGSWLLTKLCGKTCSGSRSAGSCSGALEGRIVPPKNTRPLRH